MLGIRLEPGNTCCGASQRFLPLNQGGEVRSARLKSRHSRESEKRTKMGLRFRGDDAFLVC